MPIFIYVSTDCENVMEMIPIVSQRIGYFWSIKGINDFQNSTSIFLELGRILHKPLHSRYE
jgi:hypothetical protein